jgi:two-component system nitrogen regulation response regulator GlnG
MISPRVLIVDDERLIRWSLERKLRDSGYAVRTAGTGEEALELFRREPAEVVLLDLRLPGIEGLEVLRVLRDLSATVQVVVVSASRQGDSPPEGVCDWLDKPFDMGEVVGLVDRATEAARA